ncbi:hypothetical protein ACER0C_002330 [Sarotherodon galilaeus]
MMMRSGKKNDCNEVAEDGEGATADPVAKAGAKPGDKLDELTALVKSLMQSQATRDQRMDKESARQEQRWKSMKHQFQQIQVQVKEMTEQQQEQEDNQIEAGGEPDEGPSLTGQQIWSLSRQEPFHQRDPKLLPLTLDDDIEHFLTTFERMAQVCRWPREEWAFRLVPLLTGKARSAYVHMDIADSEVYDKVKDAILAKYEITADTYRRRFRALDIHPGETPRELYVRLKDTFYKWAKPEKSTVKDISELMILEQFLRMVHPDLEVWIREHAPKSAEEASQLAEIFISARTGSRGITFGRDSFVTGQIHVDQDHNLQKQDIILQAQPESAIPSLITTRAQSANDPLKELPFYDEELESDGLVERFNQTLKNMLRKFVTETGSDWDQWLPYLLFAYREVPQASTGFSPFELLYGRQVRGPLDLLTEQWKNPQPDGDNVIAYVLKMRERLEQMTILAQQNMKVAQNKQKTWYDKKARERTFQPGQQVLLLLPTTDSKLLARWQGPYKITKRLSKVNYELYMPDRRKKHQVFHINLLKEFTQQHQQQPPTTQQHQQQQQQQLPMQSMQQFDPYPMPRIDELLERVGRSKLITTLDLSKGYWQVALAPEAKELTAFKTPFGLFQFRVMPFGLQGAPATFQRLMDQVLRDVSDLAATYLDDVVIFSQTWEQHVAHLRRVLKLIKSAGLTINPHKCKIAETQVEYLGYVVGHGQVKPQVGKMEAIHAYPVPTTKKKVRAFIGLVGWYSKFIPHFAERAARLTDLTKASALNRVKWTKDCDRAFIDLKSAITSDSVLHSPDFTQPFTLQTDASGVGIGAVLLQEVEGVRRPVVFLSRKLQDRESRYSTVEKECLAMKWAVESLRYYLLGRHFTLETDHCALQWLHKMKETNMRVDVEQKGESSSITSLRAPGADQCAGLGIKVFVVESDSSGEERPVKSLRPTPWVQQPATEGAAQGYHSLLHDVGDVVHQG